MRVALAQINPVVGDIAGNTSLVLRSIERAREAHAALVVFPELTVFGYPPKDLVRRQDLVQANVAAVDRIAEQCQGLTAVVGYVEPDPTGDGTGLFNAAAVCADGVVIARYRKRLLPTYDVFDESRYFNPGQDVTTFELTDDERSITAGVTICEDLWNDHQFEGRKVYNVDPVRQTVDAGIGLLINCSGSPYRAGVQADREALFARQIREHGIPLVYVNQVGGNDDLIFDGASLVLDAEGQVIARAKTLEEDFLLVDLDNPGTNRIEHNPDRIDGIHKALVLGVRDYLIKCGFDSVVLGLSGGIDSALTAAIAVEAVGADHVHGIALPSRFSSDHSRDDARRLAENLGIAYSVVSIEETHRALEQAVGPFFAAHGNSSSTVAEENLQARIRGNILMALSNKSGALLLTTGNKSELAVGYCTLYGDMCGGLAVLSDVPKTVVYQLAERINAAARQELIPRNTIDKPPSAELRPNQTDQDTLPPYDVLDAILERYVEREDAVADIVAEGFDAATVDRVTRMVDRNEYKRQQAAVGLKVTSRAFGTGRRMPIAAKYHAPPDRAAQ